MGLVPAGGNPCRFVTKYRSRRLERFLTEEEFRRLGRVLDELEAEERLPVYSAAAALRLLMLTGCRCSEIMTLRWEDVHIEVSEIRLRDSKTGPRVVPLSPAAARVLAGLPHAADNPWVIAGRKPGTRLSHIAYHWYRVRDRAKSAARRRTRCSTRRKRRGSMVDPDRNPLSGLVEIDETSLPFRTKNDPAGGGPGRSHDGKLLVVGGIEVGDGNRSLSRRSRSARLGPSAK